MASVSETRGTREGCHYQSWLPKAALATVIVLGILALLTVALSVWANAKIAAVGGGKAVLQHSPYSIALPAALTAVMIAGAVLLLKLTPAKKTATEVAPSIHQVSSPFTGECQEVFVKVGDHVTAETVLCSIEAMKMKMMIKAGTSGTISQIHITPNTIIETGAPLIEITT